MLHLKFKGCKMTYINQDIFETHVQLSRKVSPALSKFKWMQREMEYVLDLKRKFIEGKIKIGPYKAAYRDLMDYYDSEDYD